MYAFSSRLSLQSFCILDFVTLFSQAGEAPVLQALCTAGIASVKESLTSDDSNCRNDPGQITNVWVVPKDFELKWLCPWSLADFGELSGHKLPVRSLHRTLPTGSILCVSYRPGQPVECQFSLPGSEMKRKWFKLQFTNPQGNWSSLWNVKQSSLKHCLRHHPTIKVKDDLIELYKSP